MKLTVAFCQDFVPRFQPVQRLALAIIPLPFLRCGPQQAHTLSLTVHTLSLQHSFGGVVPLVIFKFLIVLVFDPW